MKLKWRKTAEQLNGIFFWDAIAGDRFVGSVWNYLEGYKASDSMEAALRTPTYVTFPTLEEAQNFIQLRFDLGLI